MGMHYHVPECRAKRLFSDFHQVMAQNFTEFSSVLFSVPLICILLCKTRCVGILLLITRTSVPPATHTHTHTYIYIYRRGGGG